MIKRPLNHKRNKDTLFPITYKCTLCGGHHTVTKKSAISLLLINVILIASLVLRSCGA